jgi:predicted hotdog family 3-hydroxylacyl-ACP dehydratase
MYIDESPNPEEKANFDGPKHNMIPTTMKVIWMAQQIGMHGGLRSSRIRCMGRFLNSN